MNDQTLAAPQEFTDETIERAAQGEPGQFTTAVSRPTNTVTVSIGGKRQSFQIPDKRAMWALPDKFLRTSAFNVCASPKTGVVTVTNEAGQHCARYRDRADALEKMEKAGVEVKELAGYERTFGTPSEEADEDHDTGTDPENPILPPKRKGRPRKQQEAA